MFNKQKLSDYYTSETMAKPDYDHVYVFVFCNPNLGLRDLILGNGTADKPGLKTGNKEWINDIGTLITPATIWTKNQFLMSNNSLAERLIPKTVTGWNKYNTIDNPFNLSGVNDADGTQEAIDNKNDGKGNVKVERSCARFDFRDGSNDDTSNPKEANTYKVITLDDENKTGIVNITLQKMALVNMNQRFYFLRRVSANGVNENIKLCGAELPWFSNEYGQPIEGGVSGNFVVDADQVWKSTTPSSGFQDHFNYPFFNEEGTVNNSDMNSDRWGTAMIADVLGRETDTDNPWNEEGKHPEYKIWRYVTENTIAPKGPADGSADPSFSYATQVNGITTGVVFKGKMKATETANISNPVSFEERNMKALYDAINNESTENRGTNTDPILYSFNNKLYVGWELVREAALEDAIADIHWVGTITDGHWEYDINRELSLYTAVFGTGGFGTYEFKYVEKDTDGQPVIGKDGQPVMKDGKIEDRLPSDPKSANSLWAAWDQAGRPLPSGEQTLMTDFKKAAVNAKFTLYQSSEDPQYGWGYYCYYYYWNRHNNNGQNGIMGPMEFCVVRNNVYKLAVTKISRLGHPRISENDPDGPKPDTPDESEDVYITVTSEVLPWVVRLNNIEF